jgi:ribosome maturation factor RimP
MLDKTKIEDIVNKALEDTDKFLVDILVSSTNVVDVFVDGDKGISIQQCVEISRVIENQFDRDIEDFELRVSSPGLHKPFKMIRQYKKYLDREIEVINKDGKKYQGFLKSLSETGFELERKIGKKKKEKVLETWLFSDIKEARPFIGF